MQFLIRVTSKSIRQILIEMKMERCEEAMRSCELFAVVVGNFVKEFSSFFFVCVRCYGPFNQWCLSHGAQAGHTDEAWMRERDSGPNTIHHLIKCSLVRHILLFFLQSIQHISTAYKSSCLDALLLKRIQTESRRRKKNSLFHSLLHIKIPRREFTSFTEYFLEKSVVVVLQQK